MIFPSEEVERARQEITPKLGGEAALPDEVYERHLALDPHFSPVLLAYAWKRQKQGDLPGAEAIARRGLNSHPCNFQFPVVLSGILAAQPNTDPMLAAGLMELGLRKLLSDPDAFQEAVDGAVLPAELSNEDAARALADRLAQLREQEPAAVAAELRPHRLIAELQEAFGNELEQRLVDDILREGETCRPLLIGVLRGVAEGYLPEGGDLMAEAALALLGEIGDPQSLPALAQFAAVDDDAISHAASWAVSRLGERRPAETLAVIRNFDRRVGGAERACMAEAVATMPDTPGKAEALAGLLENFSVLSQEERADVFVVIATALLAVGGRSGPERIRKALKEFSPLLPGDVGGQIEKILRSHAADPDQFRIAPDDDSVSVYDICCADRLAPEEDGDDEDDRPEPIVRPPAPGRNDPCWCGSGKKYKKCHLTSDETGLHNSGSRES